MTIPKGFECLDCQKNTFHEYFMVKDEVWLEANPAGSGKLCVGCLEKRLGRRLRPADFPDTIPLNRLIREGQTKASKRLLRRMQGTAERSEHEDS